MAIEIQIFRHASESEEDYQRKCQAIRGIVPDLTYPDVYAYEGNMVRESRSMVTVPACPLDARVQSLPLEAKRQLHKRGLYPDTFRGVELEECQFGVLAELLGTPQEELQVEYTVWKRLYDYLSERLSLMDALQKSSIGKAASYHYSVTCSVQAIGPGIYEVHTGSFNATIQCDEAFLTSVLGQYGRGYTAEVLIWQAIEPFAPPWWEKAIHRSA